MGAYRKLAATCTGLSFAMLLAGGAVAAQATTPAEQAKIDADLKETQANEAAIQAECRNLPSTRTDAGLGRGAVHARDQGFASLIARA